MALEKLNKTLSIHLLYNSLGVWQMHYSYGLETFVIDTGAEGGRSDDHSGSDIQEAVMALLDHWQASPWSLQIPEKPLQ